MGLDQVGGGLEVSVAEWSDQGVRTPVLDGVIRSVNEALSVLTLARLFDVKRGLIDPSPDRRMAAAIVAAAPEVFAIHEGSQHNAASLTEVAWRRMQTDSLKFEDGGMATRLVTIEPDLVDATKLVTRVFVPPGEAPPSHVVLDLTGGEIMERTDGSMIVEKVSPLHEVGLASAGAPVLASRFQVWSLAPTTSLPPQGWTLALSVYANGALIHERLVTQHQMMGLGALANELARDVVDWIERTMIEKPGPYTAEFTVFAGQTQIHQEATLPFTILEALAGSLHDKAVLSNDWIVDNAVAMETAYPGINLPPEGPYDLPDPTTDAYDYQR
jgi:hypothetical protein